jgi:hypothetical protein
MKTKVTVALTPIQQELYDNMSGELGELKVSDDDVLVVLSKICSELKVDGEPTCTTCGEANPLMFYKSNKTYCKSCFGKRLNEWRRKNKAGVKDPKLSDPVRLEDAVLDVLAKSSVSDTKKTQLLYNLHDRFNEDLED